MRDVKDILDEAQEKMDMAVMSSGGSIGSHPQPERQTFVCWMVSVWILTEAWFLSTM